MCIQTYGQTIKFFEFSRCLKEHMNDSSEVLVRKNKAAFSEIVIRTYGPCNGNFDSGVEKTDDTINLKFWTKPIIVTDKNGNITELYEVAECYCMFKFTYHIADLTINEKHSINVNGKTLQDIDRNNILTEFDLEMYYQENDSLK